MWKLVPNMGTYLTKKYEHQFYCSRPNPYSGIPAKLMLCNNKKLKFTSKKPVYPASFRLKLISMLDPVFQSIRGFLIMTWMATMTKVGGWDPPLPSGWCCSGWSNFVVNSHGCSQNFQWMPSIWILCTNTVPTQVKCKNPHRKQWGGARDANVPSQAPPNLNY